MNDCFEQIDFDPESIGFKSLPTMSKHIVDAMLPGQHIQEYDKMTCEPHPSCLRCYAGIPEFLRTDLPSAPKSMKIRREELPVICMNTMIHRTPLWPCLRFP